MQEVIIIAFAGGINEKVYWIFLTIFIIAVFIPDIVSHGVFFINEEKTEELAILVLGSLAFIIFFLKEKKLDLYNKERIKIQVELNRILKDLRDSYSYIGEVNRKLDILKGISDEVSSSVKLSDEEEKRSYGAIIQAIKLLEKTNKFVVRIMNSKTGKTESEIKGTRNFYANIDNKFLEEKTENNILEHGNYIAVCSPRNIGDNNACVIFLKDKRPFIEDTGILKLLVSQALFLFSCQKSAKV